MLANERLEARKSASRTTSGSTSKNSTKTALTEKTSLKMEEDSGYKSLHEGSALRKDNLRQAASNKQQQRNGSTQTSPLPALHINAHTARKFVLPKLASSAKTHNKDPPRRTIQWQLLPNLSGGATAVMINLLFRYHKSRIKCNGIGVDNVQGI